MTYSIQDCATYKGWTVIKSVPVNGDGVQAPGAIVMCEIGNERPYAIHFFNEQDGGFHMGSYCEDRKEAEDVYAMRVLKYLGRNK
jgi:hypothetical protein